MGAMSDTPRDENQSTEWWSGRDAIRRLRSRLETVPDIRVQRVYQLRLAIGRGHFAISPERIAEAMLAGE